MVHVGDIGTVITLTPSGDTDISAASAAEVHYRKPSGVTGTWTASVVSNAVAYTTVADDIDEYGAWSLQAAVILSTWAGVSTAVIMTVGENISV